MTTEASYYYTSAIEELSHTSSLDDSAPLYEELDPMVALQEDSPSTDHADEVLSEEKDLD